MKRLELACLLIFIILSMVEIGYAQVMRLEFAEVEFVQHISDGLLIRINGEDKMILRPKQESMLIVLHMKEGGERTVGFNIREGQEMNQPAPMPTPTLQPPDQNYKHRIDITGQDILSIKQKLQECKLTKREQEIITNWLSRSKLDRYTTFAIGYDKAGNLVLKLSGPSSQASTVYEKRILSSEPVSIWKPKEELPPKVEFQYDSEMASPKFKYPYTPPVIGGIPQGLSSIELTEYPPELLKKQPEIEVIYTP